MINTSGPSPDDDGYSVENDAGIDAVTDSTGGDAVGVAVERDDASAQPSHGERSSTLAELISQRAAGAVESRVAVSQSVLDARRVLDQLGGTSRVLAQAAEAQKTWASTFASSGVLAQVADFEKRFASALGTSGVLAQVADFEKTFASTLARSVTLTQQSSDLSVTPNAGRETPVASQRRGPLQASRECRWRHLPSVA